MLLILYSTKNGANVINKTLENPLNIDIIVRSDFDIINPQLKLSKISGVDFKDYNYCHIPDLNRYYFINSVSAINADIFGFECECDVLETYKDIVLSSNCRFKRKIKAGDYDNVTMLETLNTETQNFISDKTMGEGSSLVLTTVGVN